MMALGEGEKAGKMLAAAKLALNTKH